MIHRDVEKTLYLPCMEVHGQDPPCTGGSYDVGDQFGGYGHPWGRLSILSCVAVVRKHRSDPSGRGPSQGVYHDKQFHEIVVDRRAC